VTADEPEIVPQAVADADQERWLTYLNYDQSVKQAVRRLGALSAENVELFRSLLMQARDRSRVAEYEAESVRRLQGEAFVGDEELQRTLIVLHAEDPHLAEEFKRVVAATGKPPELDQAIAAIRTQKDAPKIKLVETPRPKTEIAEPAIPQPEIPKPVIPTPDIPKARIKETPILKALEPAAKNVPAEPPQAPPYRKLRAAAPPAMEPAERRSWKGPLIIAAALLVAVLAGLAVLWPRPATQESATAPRLATAPQAAVPQPAAPTSQSSPVAAPAQTQAANQTPPRAPAVDIAMPAQSDGKTPEGKKPPEIRPASDATDRIASDRIAPQAAPADASPTPAPVPGAYYKVVRGDMLSEIAVRAYRDASKFLIIQKANPSLRASADRILVDQVIFIPRAP
jgi:LysM repeat protein